MDKKDNNKLERINNMNILIGIALGLGFAMFFPEPFTNLKTKILLIIKSKINS